MKKEDGFIYSMRIFFSFLVVFFFVISFFEAVGSGWKPLTAEETKKFLREVNREDRILFSEKEGLMSVRVIFGLPSRQKPTLFWLVRMTKAVPSSSEEEELFVKKNFYGFGRFYLYDESADEGENVPFFFDEDENLLKKKETTILI